jgi:hypothetical protein
MSEQQNFGFGKFVPGFDFLQSLSKGVSQPSVSNWVAPTLNVEELDKRIGELKAVSFWLEQNSRALAATIQALELQKMTLATLKGMNFEMGELAHAMKLKPGTGAAQAGSISEPATRSGSIAGAAQQAVAKTRASKARTAKGSADAAAGGTAAGVVDPMQWWGSLTQQFQEIAAGALREAAKQPAVDAARELSNGVATQATMAANDIAIDARRRKPVTGDRISKSRKAVKKGARKAGAPAH